MNTQTVNTVVKSLFIICLNVLVYRFFIASLFLSACNIFCGFITLGTAKKNLAYILYILYMHT